MVSAKSPSLSPSLVKSKRSTAMPAAASPRLMAWAAFRFLPQVKQGEGVRQLEAGGQGITLGAGKVQR